ncbi:MAG TPA: hypothetical protein VJ577_11105, partial [Burkholderiaceae bacterium]|nr:hypothetical protein [Burkholderiaceae bacterium]
VVNRFFSAANPTLPPDRAAAPLLLGPRRNRSRTLSNIAETWQALFNIFELIVIKHGSKNVPARLLLMVTSYSLHFIH